MQVFTIKHRILIRDSYNDDIMDRLKAGELIDPYILLPFDWIKYMTPIEMNMWRYFRSNHIIFYPQVVCGDYFIDFANPQTGEAVEVDGAIYHTDFEKDKTREEYIRENGYPNFTRIAGKDTYKFETYDNDDMEIDGIM